VIAAPSPNPAPAWVNDHRHAGHQRTYFAPFPEKRACLWGCSLRAGSALPRGSCEQPSLPAADGLLLAGRHRPGSGLRPCCAAAAPRARGRSFAGGCPRKGGKEETLHSCVLESWNHRMGWVGRDLKDHLVPAPLP